MQLIDSETYINLARAFSSECQAQTRYKFIEYGARMQGLNNLAEIVDKVVYNEFNHARMFYTYIQKASNKTIENIEVCQGLPFKEKWDLVQNLKFATEDEQGEAKIYINFAKIADKEGFTEIGQLFKNISKIETSHAKLFNDLYNQFNEKSVFKKQKPTKWKCMGCGHEMTSLEAWTECPVCKAKQGFIALKV